MATVTSNLPSASLIAARKIFNDSLPSLEAAQGWTRYVLGGGPQSTNGKPSAQYGWLTDIPKMSPWSGSLQKSSLIGMGMTLTNQLHKAAFSVERQAYERDELGMIGPKSQQLAAEVARYPGELLIGLINGGGSAILNSPVFDGGAFFSNSRTYGSSGTIDNIHTTAGTSAANFRTNLAAAREAMMGYGDYEGRKLNIGPNVILIPPAQSMIVWEGLTTGPGATNPGLPPLQTTGQPIWQAGGYTVVEDANITDTGAQYFMHVSPGLAPLIFQEEFRPTIESVMDERARVEDEEYTFSARGSFQVGFGLPWLCILNT